MELPLQNSHAFIVHGRVISALRFAQTLISIIIYNLAEESLLWIESQVIGVVEYWRYFQESLKVV